jgi:hypothetical protein
MGKCVYGQSVTVVKNLLISWHIMYLRSKALNKTSVLHSSLSVFQHIVKVHATCNNVYRPLCSLCPQSYETDLISHCK